MTQQLIHVAMTAAIKSHKFTKDTRIDLRRTTLQNQFVKEFNSVLNSYPLCTLVTDIELEYSNGAPIAKKPTTVCN